MPLSAEEIAAKRAEQRRLLKERIAAGRKAAQAEATPDEAPPPVRASTPPPRIAHQEPEPQLTPPMPTLAKQRSVRHLRTPTKDVVAVSPSFDSSRPPTTELPPVPFSSGSGLNIVEFDPRRLGALPAVPPAPAREYDSDSSSLEEFNRSVASAEKEESLLRSGSHENLLLNSDDDEFPSLLEASTSYRPVHPLVATPTLRYSSSDEESFDRMLDGTVASVRRSRMSMSSKADDSPKLGSTIARTMLSPPMSSPKPRPMSPASSNGSESRLPRLGSPIRPRSSIPSAGRRLTYTPSERSAASSPAPRKSMIATPSRLPAATSRMPAR